ncbi:Sushi: von Willebrand factor type A: EGF and pentraxin domain-containing protein 1-like protein, partial [Dinothrombium tinctorium]
LNCDELPAVQNGGFKISGDYFGARATYTCDEGFYMSGPRERVCQGDGSWSDQPPECRKEAMCGMPLSVPHAKHSAPLDQNDFPIDSMVHYTCFPGYESKGFVKAKCLFYNGTAQWFGPDLKCIRDIENGQREGNLFTFTSKVTYQCNEGYELVGRANRYCQSNGQWSGVLPSCRPVECPQPDKPENGLVIYKSLVFNSVISYECRYGYKLVGPKTRFCGPMKQWLGESPRCAEIDCESPGVLHNGYLEGMRTTLGSVIYFHCFEGMVFDGGSNITTCLENGTWSHPLPNCLAPCIVPDVFHGRVNGIGPGQRVPHGHRIEADCKPQYELTFNSTPALCNNGSWTYVPKSRCKKLPERPKNGLVIAPRTDHGMKALFQCHDGYSLDGPNVTECHFGKWLQPSPVCQEIYCPFPGFLPHGRVLLVGHMGSYDYRPYVRRVTNNRQILYECEKGYYVKGAMGATCVAGQWSPRKLPECVKGSHPNVKWFERNRRHVSESAVVETIPTTAAMRRKRGKRAIPKVPRFKQKLPRKVVWNIMRGRHQGRHQRPKVPCKGFRSNPTMKLSVTKIGEGPETYSHGAIVKVSCSPGYELNIGKNRTVRCIRGFWKPKEPECIISPCTVPLIANGVYYLHHIKVQSGNTISHGEAIHLQCLSGFQSRGSHSMRCWYGNWSAHATPECVPAPCSLPEIVSGYYVKGYRAGLTIAHGSFIQYECDSGFVQAAEVPPRCIEGRLMPHPPHCIERKFLTNSVVEGSGREVITRNDDSDENVDYEDELRLKELLKVDQALLSGQDPNKIGKWCASPDKLEHVLKHSIASSDATSDSTTLSLISVAEINDESFNATNINESEKAYNLTQFTTTPFSLEPNVSTIENKTIDNSSKSSDSGRTYPPNTELIFRCVPIAGANHKRYKYTRKRSWKITCEDGDWFGRPIPCDEEVDFSIEELANRTCYYSPETTKGHNVLAFFQDKLLEEYEEFPPSTVLLFRCVDIGKYTLIGSTRRKCTLGDWDGVRPTCYGLSQEHDYALEKAPTILFRHQLGPIAQSNDGKLIVYPGIILHLECLWIRKYGNPIWEVSHDSRNYQQGWTTEPGRDSNLEYRLSIYHVRKDDTGRYTCITPVKHRHSVDIIVKESDGLILSNPSTKMNTKVMFACRQGMRLNGSEESVCLPSGNWSNPQPNCIVTECPDISKPKEVIEILSKFNTSQIISEHEHKLLKIIINGRRVGNKVTFACPPGYTLDGAHELVCLDTGQWSHSLPKCQVVTCDAPEIPKHGYLQDGEPRQKRYGGGYVLQFGCNTGYMMEGNPIIVCQENKRWSAPPPNCVPACTYPGTTSGGSISKVKFYYNVNETVTFDCGKEYELIGPRVLKCLETGRWSNAIPICSPLKKG